MPNYYPDGTAQALQILGLTKTAGMTSFMAPKLDSFLGKAVQGAKQYGNKALDDATREMAPRAARPFRAAAKKVKPAPIVGDFLSNELKNMGQRARGAVRLKGRNARQNLNRAADTVDRVGRPAAQAGLRGVERAVQPKLDAAAAQAADWAVNKAVPNLRQMISRANKPRSVMPSARPSARPSIKPRQSMRPTPKSMRPSAPPTARPPSQSMRPTARPVAPNANTQVPTRPAPVRSNQAPTNPAPQGSARRQDFRLEPMEPNMPGAYPSDMPTMRQINFADPSIPPPPRAPRDLKPTQPPPAQTKRPVHPDENAWNVSDPDYVPVGQQADETADILNEWARQNPVDGPRTSATAAPSPRPSQAPTVPPTGNPIPDEGFVNQLRQAVSEGTGGKYDHLLEQFDNWSGQHITDAYGRKMVNQQAAAAPEAIEEAAKVQRAYQDPRPPIPGKSWINPALAGGLGLGALGTGYLMGNAYDDE